MRSTAARPTAIAAVFMLHFLTPARALPPQNYPAPGYGRDCTGIGITDHARRTCKNGGKSSPGFWTPTQVAEYLDLLLEKADESWYPSGQIFDRVHRILATAATVAR